MDDDNVLTSAECMLCFESISGTELRGCELCKKEWCNSCDSRWRVARMSASLLPTCPFCRKRLDSEETVVLQEVVLAEEQLDRLMISLMRWLSYVLLTVVLLLLPLVEAYLTDTDELFMAYFCLILFIFLFLCCHYINKNATDDDHDEEVLSIV